MFVLTKLPKYICNNLKINYILIGYCVSVYKVYDGWELFRYKCDYNRRTIINFRSWIDHGLKDDYYNIALTVYNQNCKYNHYINDRHKQWKIISKLIELLSNRLKLINYIYQLYIQYRVV